MLCIFYVTLAGFALGIVGLIVESVLPAQSQRRWIWCIVIPISIFLPGYNRIHHSISMDSVIANQTMAMSSHPMVAAPLGALHLDWWNGTDVYNHAINRGWRIASMLLLLWGAFTALRAGCLIFMSRRRRITGESNPVVDGVPVIVTESVGPATVGLLRSRVLVPKWVLALPPAHRQYIVRHEEEHRRTHDARLLLCASLLIVLAPWNLALWWELRRLHLAIERDCDNRVVRALGDAHSYGEMLVNVAQASSRGPRLQPALLGNTGSLERRLKALLAPRQLRVSERIALGVVAIALLAIVAVVPHPITAHEARLDSQITAKK